jgi:cytochrome b6-f complex iron-sulfur subunit
MKRREFFKQYLSKAFSFICAVFFAYPIISFLVYKKKYKQTVVFNQEDQLNSISIKEQVILIKSKNSRIALSRNCPHLGCSLNLDPSRETFSCPCHGSRFNIKGEYLSGPADKNMQMLQIASASNNAVIVRIDE